MRWRTGSPSTRHVTTPTRALEDKVIAFDNICLRRILLIPYTDHVTNADDDSERLSTATAVAHPDKTSPFLRQVARMGDMQDTFRALHTSARGLPQGLEAPPRSSTSNLDPHHRR